MKILPTSLIKELDALTIQEEPIASIELMERAAMALTEAICSRYPHPEQPFILFAGPGNNGGDALAVARLMADRGYRPEVFLFNPKGKLSDDCASNRERLLEEERVTLHEVNTQFVPPRLTAETVVVDGLFGSGLNKPLSGGFAAVVRFINASPATVISIDMPSGLMGEDNSFNQPQHIIRADLTLSLQLPKLAFLLPENETYVGEWQLLDIGLSKKGLETLQTAYQLSESSYFKGLFPRRNKFAHKGDFGRALLIAGSEGMAGAAVLAARACLRCGVGLLTTHVPFCNNFIQQTSVPEAMTDIDVHERFFSEAVDSDRYRAVAIGPGLGTARLTEQAVLEQIGTTLCPMVIDADALNLLAGHTELLQQLPKGSILTPHPGELERLVGKCTDGYERLQRARALAEESKAVVVLKGAYSAVIAPDGNVWFNPSGNPGMATGGSGDALTGILLALLAQGMESLTAARLGVYLHGVAGDLAAQSVGETSLIAGDLIRFLPEAISSIR